MPIKNIAYFITPHGFGHATRAAAVMQYLRDRDRNIIFHIFTKAPQWIFQETLLIGYVYHPLLVDIGFVQKNSFEEDIEKTLQALSEFYPVKSAFLSTLANQLTDINVSCVLCDIAPLGILAAEKAGIPSILIENFTWDWIYQAYTNIDNRFNNFTTMLSDTFCKVNYHIQTKPICRDSSICQLITNPVSRKPRSAPHATRDKLGIPSDHTLIYLALNQVNPDMLRNVNIFPQNISILAQGLKPNDFLIKNLVNLPDPHSQYNPDLVIASDVVIGKVGYSTLAEVYNSSSRFLYIGRPQFPESIPLSQFIKDNITSQELFTQNMLNGVWIEQAVELSQQPVHRHDSEKNGADEICDYLFENHLLKP